MEDQTRPLSQIVDFEARLYNDLGRLAKQHVRGTDPDKLIHLRLSGELRVEDLKIQDEAMNLSAEELSKRLVDLFNETLVKAQELALARLGVQGEGWEQMGLPTEEAEPRSFRD